MTDKAKIASELVKLAKELTAAFPNDTLKKGYLKDLLKLQRDFNDLVFTIGVQDLIDSGHIHAEKVIDGIQDGLEKLEKMVKSSYLG